MSSASRADPEASLSTIATATKIMSTISTCDDRRRELANHACLEPVPDAVGRDRDRRARDLVRVDFDRVVHRETHYQAARRCAATAREPGQPVSVLEQIDFRHVKRRLGIE